MTGSKTFSSILANEGSFRPAKVQYPTRVTGPGAAERISEWLRTERAPARFGIALLGLTTFGAWGPDLGFNHRNDDFFAGAYYIVNGHSVSGSLMSGSGVNGLVGVFVFGSQKRRHERQSRMNCLLKLRGRVGNTTLLK